MLLFRLGRALVRGIVCRARSRTSRRRCRNLLGPACALPFRSRAMPLFGVCVDARRGDRFRETPLLTPVLALLSRPCLLAEPPLLSRFQVWHWRHSTGSAHTPLLAFPLNGRLRASLSWKVFAALQLSLPLALASNRRSVRRVYLRGRTPRPTLAGPWPILSAAALNATVGTFHSASIWPCACPELRLPYAAPSTARRCLLPCIHHRRASDSGPRI